MEAVGAGRPPAVTGEMGRVVAGSRSGSTTARRQIKNGKAATTEWQNFGDGRDTRALSHVRPGGCSAFAASFRRISNPAFRLSEFLGRRPSGFRMDY